MLMLITQVKTRQLLGLFHPNGPAGLDLEPGAWGGGRFPVQVRFTPGGQMLVLHEAMLGDVPCGKQEPRSGPGPRGHRGPGG